MRLPQGKDKTYKVGSFINSLEKMQVEGRSTRMKDADYVYNIRTRLLCHQHQNLKLGSKYQSVANLKEQNRLRLFQRD